MTDMNDKAMYVAMIQGYLGELSKMYGEIPYVYPDGIYGKETKEAVKIFQKISGLEANGIVDRKTLETLYRQYLEAKKLFDAPVLIDPFSAFLKDGQITEGEEFALVSIIQVMLNSVAVSYDELSVIDVNGIFDDATKEAIKLFQTINGISPSGNVDKETWDRLAGEYNVYVRNNE